MKESSLQNCVLKYLNVLENCCAENVSGNSHQSGRPDINGVYRGRSFRIELKTLDNCNKPTLKQFLNLKKWFKAGAAICVAYTLADVQKFIGNMSNETPWNEIYTGNCCAFGYYRTGRFTDDFFNRYKRLYIKD